MPDNHDEILDTGLLALEEIVAFGTSYKFRPPEPGLKQAPIAPGKPQDLGISPTR